MIKAKVLLIVFLVVSIMSLGVVAEATDDGTILTIDEQIALYTQNSEILTENIKQGIIQIEQMKIQLNQLVGAKFSLERLKQELLKPVEEIELETLADDKN